MDFLPEGSLGSLMTFPVSRDRSMAVLSFKAMLRASRPISLSVWTRMLLATRWAWSTLSFCRIMSGSPFIAFPSKAPFFFMAFLTSLASCSRAGEETSLTWSLNPLRF